MSGKSRRLTVEEVQLVMSKEKEGLVKFKPSNPISMPPINFFLNPNKSKMEFNIIPFEARYTNLKYMIENGGGEYHQEDFFGIKDGIDTIVDISLVKAKGDFDGIVVEENFVSSRFIFDSVAQNKALDIEKYRFSYLLTHDQEEEQKEEEAEMIPQSSPKPIEFQERSLKAVEMVPDDGQRPTCSRQVLEQMEKEREGEMEKSPEKSVEKRAKSPEKIPKSVEKSDKNAEKRKVERRNEEIEPKPKKLRVELNQRGEEDERKGKVEERPKKQFEREKRREQKKREKIEEQRVEREKREAEQDKQNKNHQWRKSKYSLNDEESSDHEGNSEEESVQSDEESSRRHQPKTRSDVVKVRRDEVFRSDGVKTRSDVVKALNNGANGRRDVEDALRDLVKARSDVTNFRSDGVKARSDAGNARRDGVKARSDAGNVRNNGANGRSDVGNVRSKLARNVGSPNEKDNRVSSRGNVSNSDENHHAVEDEIEDSGDEFAIEDPEEEDEEEQPPPRRLPAQPRSNSRSSSSAPNRTAKRRPYTSADDEKILKVIGASQWHGFINGNLIWHEMAKSPAAFNRSRTFHSLRNRFLKSILPKIKDRKKNQLGISQAERNRYKEGENQKSHSNQVDRKMSQNWKNYNYRTN